jgi:uncharacterized membrane protein HdeD (DUF308 family)
MPLKSSRRAGRCVSEWINLICGVLLFVSPWVLAFSADETAAAAAWLGGAIIAVMGFVALAQFAEFEDWFALVAGVLVIIAPWALGFAAMGYAVWAFVVLGLIVAVASVWEIWTVHHSAVATR